VETRRQAEVRLLRQKVRNHRLLRREDLQVRFISQKSIEEFTSNGLKIHLKLGLFQILVNNYLPPIFTVIIGDATL
jgi:hypothetical protein